MYSIQKSYATCQLCSLRGKPSAILDTNVSNLAELDVVFVGENPGKVEIARDKPFTGRTGLYLRQQMSEILSTCKWLFTNVVMCATIEDGKTVNPSMNTAKECCANVLQLLALAHPKYVCILGRVPLITLVKKDATTSYEHWSMAALTVRAHSFDYIFQGPEVFARYHPRYIMQSDEGIKRNYRDFFISLYDVLRQQCQPPGTPAQPVEDYLASFEKKELIGQ